MNVYIFRAIEQLTDRYHSDGGLVVIAKDAAHVTEQCASIPCLTITEQEWQSVIVYPTSADAEPSVYIFPDAGCC